MESHVQSGIFGSILSLAKSVERDEAATQPVAPIAVSPGRVLRSLGIGIAVLVALNIAAGVTGKGDQIFVLDTEQSVPAYFSTLLLVAAAALLALIAAVKRRAGDRHRLHWAALSAIFAYLSLDELVGIHEMMGPRVNRVVETSGVFHYASTVFTGALVLMVGLSFLHFFLHLSPRYRALFAASASLYVGGALVMEMISAVFDSRFGAENLGYLLITTVEETMEMAGIALFIYALLEYVRTHLRGAVLRVADPV